MATAGIAGAQPQVTPIPSLVYDAPATCPDESEFAHRLRSRLGSVQATDMARRTLEVRIQAVDARYVGRLSLAQAGGGTTTRTLDAAACEELVDALSLIAALAVHSVESGATSEEHPAAPIESAPKGTDRAAPPPPPPPVAPSSNPAPIATTSSPGSVTRSSPRASTARTRVGLRLGGQVGLGLAPEPVFGASLGADWSWVTAGAFTPAFGLSVLASGAPSVTEAGGTAHFAWFVLRPNACLVKVTLGHLLDVRGCLVGDLGWVRAQGTETVSPATSWREWLSLGLGVDLEVPLGSRWAIRLMATGEAPVRRDRYAFGGLDFFVVPVVVGTGTLSLEAYVFP